MTPRNTRCSSWTDVRVVRWIAAADSAVHRQPCSATPPVPPPTRTRPPSTRPRPPPTRPRPPPTRPCPPPTRPCPPPTRPCPPSPSAVDRVWWHVDARWWQVDGVWWYVDTRWWRVDEVWWRVDTRWWRVDGVWWHVDTVWCAIDACRVRRTEPDRAHPGRGTVRRGPRWSSRPRRREGLLVLPVSVRGAEPPSLPGVGVGQAAARASATVHAVKTSDPLTAGGTPWR
jgi:hypothetical protein